MSLFRLLGKFPGSDGTWPLGTEGPVQRHGADRQGRIGEGGESAVDAGAARMAPCLQISAPDPLPGRPRQSHGKLEQLTLGQDERSRPNWAVVSESAASADVNGTAAASGAFSWSARERAGRAALLCGRGLDHGRRSQETGTGRSARDGRCDKVPWARTAAVG